MPQNTDTKIEKIDSNNNSNTEKQNESTENFEKKGNLILDATVAPSDITYPTDVKVLNSSRENTEDIIDTLHEPDTGTKKKPRTYRAKARKNYLGIEKKRRKTIKAIKVAIKSQLSYVKRNLKIIENYLKENPDRMELLSNAQKNKLETIKKIYEQQKYMFENDVKKVDDRIVSVSQPYIRPIVRGKAGKKVEFGSKLLTSVVDGYSFVDLMSFDSYNEGCHLQESVEKYRDRFGYYPEAVMADTIFRTKDNRAFLKNLDIRMSGPRLGRPPKDKEKSKAIKKQEKEDFGIRNNVEASYGVAKRKYSLGLIKSKTEITTNSEIAIQFLAMNLGRLLKVLRIFFEKKKYQYNFNFLIALV